MRYVFRTSAIILALLGSVGFAAAQGRATGANLSQSQQQAVKQGLGSEQAQTAPAGAQAQVGGKLPDSMQAAPMPSKVAADVPQAKNLLFVKLPDRIILVDPNSQLIAEIIPIGETTGSESGSTPK
jgi:hypothetical protein